MEFHTSHLKVPRDIKQLKLTKYQLNSIERTEQTEHSALEMRAYHTGEITGNGHIKAHAPGCVAK